MKDFEHINKRIVAAVVTVAVIVIAAAAFLSGCGHSASANAPTWKQFSNELAAVRSDRGPIAQPTELDQD